MSSRALPSRIGRYEVVDRLGAGGMGVLYLARDPLLRRTLAIKVLAVDDDDLRERFAREARSAASLSHTNIVTIFDVGEDAGHPFLAMEYLDGETMAEMIRRKAPIALQRRLQLLLELCAGLGYAHRLGIIHRDIKPANLMITGGGTLKILDFGLARLTHDNASGLTQSGALLGTPHYMSPEQIEGRPVDHRSDIFSVGLVLYELLTYRKAYSGEGMHVVLHKITHERPQPLREVDPTLDPALERIVEKAIEREPDRRYQSLELMSADTTAFLKALAGRPDADATVIIRRDQRPEATPRKSDAGSGGVRTPSATPRVPNFEGIARRREAQIQLHVDEATRHFDEGRYEQAIEQCELAAVLNPEEPRVFDLLSRAHGALEEQQIAAWLAQARARMAEGSLTLAEQLIQQSLERRAGHPDAEALRRELFAARRQQEQIRERARAVANALERARAHLAQGAFEAVARAANEALAFDPEQAEALALKQQALDVLDARRRELEHEQRASSAAAAARRAAQAGDLDGAAALLDAFTPPHTIVTAARAEIQTRIDARERAFEQAAAAKAAARAAIEAGDWAAADNALQQALAAVAKDAEVPELRRVLHVRRAEAEEAERRRNALRQHVADAERLLAAAELTSSLRSADLALEVDPEDAAAKSVRGRAAAAVDERRRAEEARAREQAERDARERAERERAREEAERQQRAREAAERQAKAEADRRAREEAEGRAREQAEREARDRADRETREKADREQRAREAAERRARENAEQQALENAAREAREKAEREGREKAEREAREKADREQRAREDAERAERARQEAERRAREEAERRAQEAADLRAREQAARDAAEKAEREAGEEAEREARQRAERDERARSDAAAFLLKPDDETRPAGEPTSPLNMALEAARQEALQRAAAQEAERRALRPTPTPAPAPAPRREVPPPAARSVGPSLRRAAIIVVAGLLAAVAAFMLFGRGRTASPNVNTTASNVSTTKSPADILREVQRLNAEGHRDRALQAAIDGYRDTHDQVLAEFVSSARAAAAKSASDAAAEASGSDAAKRPEYTDAAAKFREASGLTRIEDAPRAVALYADAEKGYRASVTASSNDPAVFVRRATDAYRNGAVDRAIEYALTARRLDPAHAAGERIIDAIRRDSARDTGRARAAAVAAGAAGSDDFAKAEKRAKDAARTASADDLPAQVTANKEAAQLYRTAAAGAQAARADHHAAAERHAEQARVLISQKKLDEAEAELAQATAAEPQNATAQSVTRQLADARRVATRDARIASLLEQSRGADARQAVPLLQQASALDPSRDDVKRELQRRNDELNARAAAPPPSPSTPAPPKEPAAAARGAHEAEVAAILTVLNRYKAAWEARDVDAIQAVYPGVNAKTLRDAFKNVRSQPMTLQPQPPDIDATGTTAVVRCHVSSRIDRRAGAAQELDRDAVFFFSKSAAGWRIAGLEYR